MQKMTPQELEIISTLVSALVETCIKSEASGVYSIFAMGIAAAAIRTICEKCALTEDAKDEVVEIFKSGLAQQFITIRTNLQDNMH